MTCFSSSTCCPAHLKHKRSSLGTRVHRPLDTSKWCIHSLNQAKAAVCKLLMGLHALTYAAGCSTSVDIHWQYVAAVPELCLGSASCGHTHHASFQACSTRTTSWNILPSALGNSNTYRLRSIRHTCATFAKPQNTMTGHGYWAVAGQHVPGPLGKHHATMNTWY
jgi:hypothetical protein